MNFSEMLYGIVELFFSDLWKYLGLLLLIITIRGDITKALNSIGRFINRTKEKYKTLAKGIDYEIKKPKADIPRR